MHVLGVFARHFPELAREIGEARRTPPPGPDKPSPAAVEQARLTARNAKLARENRRLREQVAVAVANIRDLALANHRMKLELEAANNVTRINTNTTSGR